MKKLPFYIIALPCLVLALDGCQKEEKTPDGDSSSEKPVISVRKPSAYSFLPGTYSLPYTIDNPREGVQLELSTNDKWITGLTADKENISFTLSANNPSEERQGSISICYEGAEPVKIEIRQKKEDIVPLDKDGITANCYIVPEAGVYQFPMVKGNSPEPVGDVASVGILWETFGTDAVPEQGDLIQIVLHEDNMVYFKSADKFRKGNAVIAARDAGGAILWSWHIWMTDRPYDQVYNNDAGTMMDRNLGATAATRGDVGSLGLLYQWGRKDPFLGSSSISEGIFAKSTIEWPSPVTSDESTGNMDYASANPTTFIMASEVGSDWMYDGGSMDGNNRWMSQKTINDPCPPGYRVPDGGKNGVWAKAFGSSIIKDMTGFDDQKKGYNFGSTTTGMSKLSDKSGVCWYPVVGILTDGRSIEKITDESFLWGCTTDGEHANLFSLTQVGTLRPASVRCMKE